MKLILIALRNLSRQKRRTFLLGGAIAFGILIVTLINGFAGSFVENVSENFSQLLAGHIFIEGVEKQESGGEVEIIRDDKALLAALEEAEVPVEFLTKRSSFSGGMVFQGVEVRQEVVGVDWQEETFLPERLVLLEGDFASMQQTSDFGQKNGIIISRDVADALNVQLDDRVDMKLRTVDGQLNVARFFVAGISFDPGLFGSISAYADISYVNELLTLDPGDYQIMGVFVPRLTMIDSSATRFFEALNARVNTFPRPDSEEEGNPVEALFEQAEEEDWNGTRYRMFTLNDLLAEAEQIVTLLDNAAFIILFVLFFIIMVGITNTFRMIMFERIREIGTVRALGMQRGSVQGLFLLEALFLAIGGVIVGMAIAALAMIIVSNIYIGLESPVYILLRNGYLTFSLELPKVLINVAIVAGLTVLAAFFPTFKASRMPPVDALRSET